LLRKVQHFIRQILGFVEAKGLASDGHPRKKYTLIDKTLKLGCRPVLFLIGCGSDKSALCSPARLIGYAAILQGERNGDRRSTHKGGLSQQ
jgi:hypothetical protein